MGILGNFDVDIDVGVIDIEDTVHNVLTLGTLLRFSKPHLIAESGFAPPQILPQSTLVLALSSVSAPYPHPTS